MLDLRTRTLALAAGFALMTLPASFAQAAPNPPAVTAPAAVAAPPVPADAGEPAPPKKRFEIYGFAQADFGYDFGRIDSKYPDRLRVSALPANDDQFGVDGRTYFSVRQSRFGTKAWLPTDAGEIYTFFEFDLEGSGADAGQTTFRLRHFYGEWGALGAGQTWSPFVDVDAYPTIFESFGPNGLPWIRSPQIRWIPIKGDNRLVLAVEKPGATADGGDYEDRIELADTKFRTKTPEFAASYRRTGTWGHLQVGGLYRRVWWDDTREDEFDFSGDARGWGLSLSSVLRWGEKNAVRLLYVQGEGIQNYMNDSTADIGLENNFSDPRRPVVGVPLPVQGASAYVEAYRGRFGVVVGYSFEDIDNSNGLSDDAFAGGQFATATLIFFPVKGVTTALEYQWAERENFRDGWTYDDSRLQASVRYTFSLRNQAD